MCIFKRKNKSIDFRKPDMKPLEEKKHFIPGDEVFVPDPWYVLRHSHQLTNSGGLYTNCFITNNTGY